MMALALRLARRGLGRVAPNPAVGCLIVKDGNIAGRGWTQPGGRPHAETEALAQAGRVASGAVAYVTLEPCAHYGKTPPCTDALIDAGIGRVVAAAQDPDPRVAGSGFEALRDAGVDVDEGCCREEAERLNEGHFRRVRDGRPMVTLKLATSLDGRIATGAGKSKWITGELSRARAHMLRAQHDALLVGSGTVLADDPDLTCRLPGLEAASPIRVVADRRGRVTKDHNVVATASRFPTWIFTAGDADPDWRETMSVSGVRLFPNGGTPNELAAALGEQGITRLMIEGGGEVAAAWLRAGLVDRIAWFRAPVVLGGDGVPAVADLDLDGVGDGPSFARESSLPCGADMLETYRRRA